MPAGGIRQRAALGPEGLLASGPAVGFEEKLELFGQFVGDWEITRQRSVPTNPPSPYTSGEIHFRWVLSGRAVQDSWGARDRRTGAFLPTATAIRFYDPALDGWRSTWLSPYEGEVRTFIGRKVGDEIVLRELYRDPPLRARIFFAEITPTSFVWRGERRPPGSYKWEVFEEIEVRRIAPTRRPVAGDEAGPSTDSMPLTPL